MPGYIPRPRAVDELELFKCFLLAAAAVDEERDPLGQGTAAEHEAEGCLVIDRDAIVSLTGRLNALLGEVRPDRAELLTEAAVMVSRTEVLRADTPSGSERLAAWSRAVSVRAAALFVYETARKSGRGSEAPVQRALEELLSRDDVPLRAVAYLVGRSFVELDARPLVLFVIPSRNLSSAKEQERLIRLTEQAREGLEDCVVQVVTPGERFSPDSASDSHPRRVYDEERAMILAADVVAVVPEGHQSVGNTKVIAWAEQNGAKVIVFGASESRVLDSGPFETQYVGSRPPAEIASMVRDLVLKHRGYLLARARGRQRLRLESVEMLERLRSIADDVRIPPALIAPERVAAALRDVTELDSLTGAELRGLISYLGPEAWQVVDWMLGKGSRAPELVPRPVEAGLSHEEVLDLMFVLDENKSSAAMVTALLKAAVDAKNPEFADHYSIELSREWFRTKLAEIIEGLLGPR